ncbi:alanine racemase [Micrococcales bacterium 31B]|nr:alanine racemase [Micrococcales bacterium 31B]
MTIAANLPHPGTPATPAKGLGVPPERFADLTGVRLAELTTPLVALYEEAISHNLATMAAWCREHDADLAPHGKTSMSPELWQRQLDAGAVAITLANVPQLQVARAHGFANLLLANALVNPADIAWVSAETARGAAIASWVDHVDTVALLDRHATATLPVMVELGWPDARTGARSVAEAVLVAHAVKASPRLRLVGVCGYEGAVAHSRDEADLATVREYLGLLAELHGECSALYEVHTAWLSAGGSAYFDQVMEVLGPVARASGARVLLRSGAYVVHDGGFCERVNPLRGDKSRAMRNGAQAFAHVVSQPEPGLALLNVGKRDVPYDIDLPRAVAIGPHLGAAHEPFEGEVTGVNDQHAFMRFDAGGRVPRIGEVVRLNLSHSCTVLDKWAALPLLDADERVLRVVRTHF